MDSISAREQSVSGATERRTINFRRPLSQGDIFNCSISAQNRTVTVREYEGSTEKKMDEYLKKVEMTGTLKIKEVAPNGNASKIEFTFDEFTGEINGKKIVPDWKGRILIADLTVKPVCLFKFKDKGGQPERDEVILLSLVFRPVSDITMADVIGTGRKLAPGDSWTASKHPFLENFKRDGIILPPEKITGNVTLKARNVYKGIDCWEIEEQLTISDVSDFSYGFFVSILLPVDETKSTVKLLRKGVTKIEKSPGAEHMMTAGIKKILITNSDAMSAEMLPVKER